MTVSVDSFAEVLTSSTMTRPDNTTAYAIGDLVANNATAGSVVALEWADASRESRVVRIERVRVRKSNTATAGASFRVHFYAAPPGTPTNGDNGEFVTPIANWAGSADVVVDRAGTDGAIGAGVSLTGTPITVKVGSNKKLYALIEARAAYTPAALETFTIQLEAYRF
ncbi:MAG: hypothetical protein RIS35_3712 [Pseudomonadota bacterium]|jgi:hypothetical protein